MNTQLHQPLDLMVWIQQCIKLICFNCNLFCSMMMKEHGQTKMMWMLLDLQNIKNSLIQDYEREQTTCVVRLSFKLTEKLYHIPH